jgi:hypothetical protein
MFVRVVKSRLEMAKDSYGPSKTMVSKLSNECPS